MNTANRVESPTTRRSALEPRRLRRLPRRPMLRFTPWAWAKLVILRDLGPTEVGGFGISSAADLLLIEDIRLVRQRCSSVTVQFDDVAVADFFDEMFDLGLPPERFARVWIHTHPGDSASPSCVDEETFIRSFGRSDWAVMFIRLDGCCRLRFPEENDNDVLAVSTLTGEITGNVMQTDRNLLFGVLAFQDEYIDLAQLAAICRAWAADKSRSIPQLRVERQWLSEQGRDELERKVERKLKRFVGDVHATLGAVADGAVRDVLKQVNDPDISQSLSSWPDSGHVIMETLVPDPQSADKTVSRYTLTHVHGKGGIGQVWLAYDKQFNREVALKELRPERSRNPDTWRRFLREAQITGQLQHPNIVPVYDLDRRAKDQQPFYTMKLVQGRTLRDAIVAYHEHREGRPGRGPISPKSATASERSPNGLQRSPSTTTLELNQLLQSFVSVCQAIAYAHSRGVVHRDLKPQNIVLGDFGEVIVLDWGEAKLVGIPDSATETMTQSNDVSDAASVRTDVSDARSLPISAKSAHVSVTPEAEPAHHTVAGQPSPGTPAYMSPEQAAGRLDQIEPRTDVYGLGTILFDIVTGQAPHRLQSGETIRDLFPRIVAQPTPSARKVAGTLRVPSADGTRSVPATFVVPVALDAICAKAMAGALTSRYSSANELAQDVQRFLADEPVSVCQDPLSIRARRWMKHHQVAVATTAAAVLMAVIGLGVLAGVTSQHNTKLLAANKKEQAATEEARRGRYAAQMTLAQRNWESSQVGLLLDSLEKTRPQPGEPDLRGFEWHYWNRLAHSYQWSLHGLTSVAFSADGKRLASASGDQTVKVWDARPRTPEP